MPIYHIPPDQDILESAEDFPLENMSEEDFIEKLKIVLHYLRFERPPLFNANIIPGVSYNDFVQNIVVFLLSEDFCRVYYNEKTKMYIFFPHSETDDDEELLNAINSRLRYDDPPEGYTREKFKEVFKRVDQKARKIPVRL